MRIDVMEREEYLLSPIYYALKGGELPWLVDSLSAIQISAL